MRPPVGRADEVAEPNRGRARARLVNDDHRVALDATRSGRHLGELPFGEFRRLAIGLHLLAKVGLGLRLRPATFHDESADAQDGPAIETALIRQAGEGHPGEALEFLEEMKVLLVDGDLVCEPLGVGAELLEQFLLRPDLLPGVFLDGAGAEPGAEHAEAVGPLGIERAVDGLRRHRRHHEFDDAFPLGDADLAGDERLSLVDRHGHDLAVGRSGRGRVFDGLAGVLVGIRCDPGAAELRAGEPGHQPERGGHASSSKVVNLDAT